MKIKMLLTFDYELPLGGWKSYDKGLFEPAQRLISLANDLKIPIVLFADICSAIQFKKWDNKFYSGFTSQIQDALRTGHDVQLHIHPHWIDSKYNDGKLFPSNKFGLSDFIDDQAITIDQIIKMAFDATEEMCREVDPDYRCIAFRAGGYNVEPESKIILNCLYKSGIKYDSSVIKGLYQKFSFSKIDYRNAPEKNSWKVPVDGPLINTTNQEPYIIEYPISCMPNSLGSVLKRRANKILHKRAIQSRMYNNSGKGYSAVSRKSGWLDKLRMAFNPVVLSFDRDYFDLRDLEKIVDYNVKKFKSEEEVAITLISHPKSMGDYHFGLMESFVSLMKKKYGDNIVFTTYSKLYKTPKC